MEWKNIAIVVFAIVTFMIGNLFGLQKSRADDVFGNKIKGTKAMKRAAAELSGFDINDLSRYLARVYIPSTPAPEDVNCHMEVQTTKIIGGRCVNMGLSTVRACQSGIHSEIYHPDCMSTDVQTTESPSPTRST